MDNTSQIKELKKRLENLVPTPPVGWPVQWYLGGNTSVARCGQVVEVQAPGQVAVSVTVPHGMPNTKSGVLHVTHPKEVEKGKHNRGPSDPGSFDYCPGQRIPKEHFELHREQLETRIRNLEDEQRKWDDAQEAKRLRAEQVQKEQQQEPAVATV